MKSTKLVLCLCLFLCFYRVLVISADAGKDIDEKGGPLYYEEGEEPSDYDQNDDFDDEEDDDYSGDNYSDDTDDYDESTDDYDESTDDYYHEPIDKKYAEYQSGDDVVKDENLSRVGDESTEVVSVKEDAVLDEDRDKYRNESTSPLGGNVDEEDSDSYNESTSEVGVNEIHNVKNDSKDEAKHVDGYDALLRRLDIEENEDANRTDGSPESNPHHAVQNFVFQLRRNRTKSTNRTAYYGVLIGPSTVVSASIKGYNRLGLSVCGDVCFKPTMVRKRGNFLVWKLPLKIKRKRVFFVGDITKAKCTRNRDTETTNFVKITKNRFACYPKCGRHDAIVCDGKVAGLLTKGTRKQGYTFAKIATVVRSFVRRELGTKHKKMGGPINLPEQPEQEYSGPMRSAGVVAKISSVLFGIILFCSLIVSL